jgi:ADP-heptose:LPS heptosyltransferase
MTDVPGKVILRQWRAPGDSIAMSALVRDIKVAFPEMQIDVSACGGDELFTHAPYLTRLSGKDPSVRVIDGNYVPSMKHAEAGLYVHYLYAFHRDFAEQTGLEVPWTDPRPDLHLTEEEKHERPFPFRYCVGNFGHKPDVNCKQWSIRRFQEVIDITSRQGLRWVQVGRTKDDRFAHHHTRLTNVIDLLDRTENLRDLMRLVYHADLVLCGVTMTMLMAAAFWRPCVVIAGGREEWWWQAYTRDNPALQLLGLADKVQVPHRYLHTIGQLDCCKETGCHCCSVVPPHRDSTFPPGFLCQLPTYEPGGQPLPECMSRITTQDAVRAVMSYYEDGTLPAP